jgi:hypothetical protein
LPETVIVAISQNKKNEENDSDFNPEVKRRLENGANFSIYR